MVDRLINMWNIVKCEHSSELLPLYAFIIRDCFGKKKKSVKSTFKLWKVLQQNIYDLCCN